MDLSHSAPPLPATVRPAAWPTPIGIVCVVFGTLGMCGSVIGFASPYFVELVANLVPEQQRGSLESVREHRTEIIVLSMVGTALAAALLLGGVALLRRRASAATVLCGWAVLKIVSAIGGGIVNLGIQRDQLAAMQEGGAGPMPMSSNFMEVMQVLGVALAILWGMALPVFLLVWFARGAVRREIASWRGGADPAAIPRGD